MKAQAIIFDCDGVLIDSERIYVTLEREMLAAIGLHYEHEAFVRRFVGTSNADFRRALAADYAALGKGPWPVGFWDRHHNEVWRRFRKDLSALPGAEAFLRSIDRPRAVASSSTIDELDRKLAFTELTAHFDGHVYSAELVDNGKPAPDLFLFAADRLKTPPEKCVVVEDSVNGVRSGAAAGMNVWGFVGGGHATPGLAAQLQDAGASAVFDTYSDIQAAWAQR